MSDSEPYLGTQLSVLATSIATDLLIYLYFSLRTARCARRWYLWLLYPPFFLIAGLVHGLVFGFIFGFLVSFLYSSSAALESANNSLQAALWGILLTFFSHHKDFGRDKL
jgi:hypothetical protein